VAYPAPSPRAIGCGAQSGETKGNTTILTYGQSGCQDGVIAGDSFGKLSNFPPIGALGAAVFVPQLRQSLKAGSIPRLQRERVAVADPWSAHVRLILIPVPQRVGLFR
jgi:hypothetical protein